MRCSSIARRTGAVLQTGHVERFNRAVRAALPYVESARFIESNRLAPFNPRGSDVAVVLDLMIHDIDLVRTFVGGGVSSVSAVGVPVLTPFVDIANARLTFEAGAVANITASRVSRDRMRKLRIFQQSGYLSLDLAAGTGEFYRLREDVDFAALVRDAQGAQALESFVERDCASRRPEGEPLRLELEAFVAAVLGEGPIAVTGEDGREALAVALTIVRDIERTLPALRGPRREPAAPRCVRFCSSPAKSPATCTRPASRARWLRAVRRYHLVGVGGDAMRDAGVELLEHVEQARGDGLRSRCCSTCRATGRCCTRLTRRIRSGNVALVVLVDYPTFNMQVAEAATEAGVPVLYYITPQVWAWGADRLARLARTVTKAAAILPFEERLLRDARDRRDVRRPSLDGSGRRRCRTARPARADARAWRDRAACSRCFPEAGTRRSSGISTSFVATARELQRRIPQLEVIVSAGAARDARSGALPLPGGARRHRSPRFAPPTPRSARAARRRSRRPLPDVRWSWRTARAQSRMPSAKWLVKIPNIGLVNVVAGRRVAPEFVQDALAAARRGRRARAAAESRERGAPDDDRRAWRRCEASLGEPGAAERVATMATDARCTGAAWGMTAGAAGASGSWPPARRLDRPRCSA